MTLVMWTIVIIAVLVVTTIIYLLIKLKSQKTDYRKLLSQKKKSEVNLGYISEKLAPFLNGFDYDPNRLIFIGKPIDYIHFGDDKITFIEVKSGNSRLTKGQRSIKNKIKENKIDWFEYRVSAKKGDVDDSTSSV